MSYARINQIRRKSLKTGTFDVNFQRFSRQFALKVYDRYLKLDTDHNGLLKKTELMKYSWGLTNVFFDRVYEEFQTFEGEIDYKTFLDFVLAMENKKTP